MNKELTKVIFKKEKGSKDIIAFFPYLSANIGNIVCYVHIGQHSEASYDYYRECKKANEEEYKALYNELSNIVGYNLKIVNRVNYDHYLQNKR